MLLIVCVDEYVIKQLQNEFNEKYVFNCFFKCIMVTVIMFDQLLTSSSSSSDALVTNGY